MALGEYSRDAFERSTGAVSRHPIIELLAPEVRDDLPRGGARVNVGVGFVLELARQEPAMRFGQLDRFDYHGQSAASSRRQHDLGAQEAHELTPLDTELLCHRDHQGVALAGAHHGEADAGVAACRLNDGLPWFELSRLLRRLDHAQRQAILHGPQWIECFNLDEQVHALRRQPVDAHHGCVADCPQNIIELRHAIPPDILEDRSCA